MRRTLLSLPAVLVLFVTPATAFASAGSDKIISECANEVLSQQYTPDQYQDALDELPADLAEYTDCVDVIKSAMRGAGIKSSSRNDTGGTTGSDGTTSTGRTGVDPTTGEVTTAGAALVTDPLASASPADQAAAKEAQEQGAGTVDVGGAVITPGDPGTVVSSLDDLPAPMIVLLVLIVAGGLGALGYFIKRRVLGHHS